MQSEQGTTKLQFAYAFFSQTLNLVHDKDVDSCGRPTSTSVVRMQARLKLTGMSEVQFQELCTDMFDELERRRAEDGSNANPLQHNTAYNQKRNQARSRLAAVGQQRLASLINDILNELLNRYPSLRGNFATDQSSTANISNIAIYQQEVSMAGSTGYSSNGSIGSDISYAPKIPTNFAAMQNSIQTHSSGPVAAIETYPAVVHTKPTINRVDDNTFSNMTHNTAPISFQELSFDKNEIKAPCQTGLPLNNPSTASLESLDSLMADLGHFDISSNSDEDLDRLKSQLAAAEQKIVALERITADNREFITQLQSENCILKADLDTSQKKAIDFEKRCTLLEKELQVEKERFEASMHKSSITTPNTHNTAMASSSAHENLIDEQAQSLFTSFLKASDDLMVKLRSDKNLVPDAMRNLIAASKQLMAIAEEIEKEIEAKRNSAEFYKEISKLKSHKTKSIQIVTSIVAALKEKNHLSMVESLLGDLTSEVVHMLDFIKKLSPHCNKSKTNSTSIGNFHSQTNNDEESQSPNSIHFQKSMSNSSLASSSTEALTEIRHLRKKSEEVIGLIHKLMETTRPMALLNPSEQCPCLSEIKSSVVHILSNAAILKAKKTTAASREKISQAIDMLKVTSEKLEDFRINLQDGKIAINDKGCKQKLVWLAYDVAKYTNELMVSLGKD